MDNTFSKQWINLHINYISLTKYVECKDVYKWIQKKLNKSNMKVNFQKWLDKDVYKNSKPGFWNENIFSTKMQTIV